MIFRLRLRSRFSILRNKYWVNERLTHLPLSADNMVEFTHSSTPNARVHKTNESSCGKYPAEIFGSSFACTVEVSCFQSHGEHDAGCEKAGLSPGPALASVPPSEPPLFLGSIKRIAALRQGWKREPPNARAFGSRQPGHAAHGDANHSVSFMYTTSTDHRPLSASRAAFKPPIAYDALQFLPRPQTAPH